MTTFKIIFAGTLDFGSERSFEKVFQLYFQRAETHFRNNILINDEELFVAEKQSLEIVRNIYNEDNKKLWSNTIKLLEYIAQFAMAGQIDAWLISNHVCLEHRVIEPTGDKSAISSFQKGRELLNKAGHEEEARIALSKAIEKFERHAMAYERRGYVNFRLRNIEDAIYDFSKSITIKENAPAFFGRANCYFTKGEYEKAIADLTMAHKRSIPHQPIFWTSRRLKAECYFLLGKFDEAIVEYKLVCNRKYKETDSNYKWMKAAWTNKGRAHMELKQYKLAAEAFSNAIEAINTGGQMVTSTKRSELLTLRAEARELGGLKGAKEDLKAAAKELAAEETSV